MGTLIIGFMTHLGTVAALARYPVKGMQGEQLNASVVTGGGLAGDRAFALIDGEGKIGTPKLPRKWAGLLQSRSRYLAEPDAHYQPPAQITLPDGERVMSDDSEVNLRLSRMVGRDVTVISEKPAGLVLESPPLGQVPDDDNGPLLQLPVPNGFFDLGSLHLLTTATLAALREVNPGVRFEPRRFRPNIIVQTPDGVSGFTENDWQGKTIAIGDDVRIRVTMPTIRCVVTTMPQDDLPYEPAVLKASAQHNNAFVGVYAMVEQGGAIRIGDAVSLV